MYKASKEIVVKVNDWRNPFRTQQMSKLRLEWCQGHEETHKTSGQPPRSDLF